MRAALASVLILLACNALRAAEPVLSQATLANGIRVVVAHVPEAPVVHCRATLEGGFLHDPRGFEGVADLFRRCTYHGTRTLGVSDPEKEAQLKSLIDKMRQGVDKRLASIPAETLKKIREYPENLKAAHGEIHELLYRITGRTPTPMSRKEMEEFSEKLRREFKELDDDIDEMERLQRDQAFGTITLVRDIEDKIRENLEALAEICLPDPIRAAYEKGGALSNGSVTEHDLTVFSALMPAPQTELFFWIESRRLLEPAFRFFDAEKAAALQDAASARISPPLVRALRQVTFAGTPLSGTDGLSAESAALIDLEALSSFHAAATSPGRITLVLVGGITPPAAFALAEKYFSDFQAGGPGLKPPGRESPLELRWRLFCGFQSAALRFQVPEASSADAPSLEVLARCLASNRSPVHKSVVQAGLAPSVEASLEESCLAGVLQLRAFTAYPTSADSLEAALLKGLAETLDAGITQADLDDAAASVQRELGLFLSRPGALADALARTVARRRAIPSIERYAGLTPEKATETVLRLLKDARPTVILTEEN